MRTTEEVEALMVRCRTGVGGRRALDEAHDIMAECYGTLGALVRERGRLRAQIETAMDIVNAGVALMTDEQVGQWTGVRSFMEQEMHDYLPNAERNSAPTQEVKP